MISRPPCWLKTASNHLKVALGEGILGTIQHSRGHAQSHVSVCSLAQQRHEGEQGFELDKLVSTFRQAELRLTAVLDEAEPSPVVEALEREGLLLDLLDGVEAG